MRGYQYIKTALEIEDAKGMMALYRRLADRHGTTADRVERCMRAAVEAAFGRMAPKVQEEIFGATISGEKGKSSNAAFLAVLRLYVGPECDKEEEA